MTIEERLKKAQVTAKQIDSTKKNTALVKAVTTASKKSRLDDIIGKINSGDIKVKQSEQDLRSDMNKTARGVTTTTTPAAAVNSALTRSGTDRNSFDSRVRQFYANQGKSTSPTSPLYIAPDLVPAMTTGGNASGSRVANTIAGAVKSVASQYTNTAGMAVNGAQELNTLASGTAQKVQAAQDNIARYQQEIQALRRNGTLTNESLAHLNQLISLNNRAIQAANGTLEAQNAGTESVAQSLNQTADKLQAGAESNIATAKQGLGTIGSALVDIGVTGTQMATDAAASALTGGNALIPMFIRSFGGGAQQAREAGADAGTQALYGLGSGVIETATEKMFNVAAPFKKMFGPGVFDKLVGKGINSAVKKLSENAVGRALITAGASAAGEGFEEFAADAMYPVLQAFTYQHDESKSSWENVKNSYGENFNLSGALYDAIIGGALGLIGATPEVIGSAMNRPTQNTTNISQDNLASPTTAQTAPTAPTVTQNVNAAQNPPKQSVPKSTVSSPLSGVASTLGDSGAKAITAFYDGSNPAKYAAEFVRTYNAGLNGKKAPVATNITPAQSYAAFSAGKNDAAAKVSTPKVTIKPLSAASENLNSTETAETPNTPKKQTLNEYLGERGLSSPVSDFMLDKTKIPNGLTQSQFEKLQSDASKAATEYASSRSQAINEYNQQVASGNIVGKTDIERLMESAQGREENESTQAARRALNKRGIDWETGEKLNASKVTITRKASANPDVDRMAAVDRGIKYEEAYASNWRAQRVGDASKKAMSLTDIVGKIRHDFDINVTKGHLETKGSKGEYNRHSEGVRVKLTNDLPTVSHELGHHLDNKFGLTKDLSEAQKAEIVNGLSDDMKAAYPKKKWVTEGLAEYVRKFLQNSATAAIKYPEFTQRFLNALPAEEKAMVEELADEVNTYYSLDAGTATSSIKLRNEKPMDFGSIGERIKAKSDEIYQAWDDSNHGIKLFDQAMGSHTYKVASNSAYADCVSGAILTGDLTNADGQYVSYGLMQALDGVNLKNKQEYKDFGEYLVVRHGPERLAEKMLVFADDRKNSKFFMDMRQGELEHKYPEFKAAADRLYTFQKNFLQTWGVQTGLVSADSAKKWAERYQYYVPFNRDVGSKKTMGAKRGYANQTSTIKQAHGSTLDIIHPVDSIVNNMVKMVNAAVRNNVMVTITDVARKHGENATFLEEIPTPMKKVTVDISGVKEKLKNSIKDSDMSKKGEDIAYGLVDGIDDILQQYGRGKAYGDVITVLRNGSPEFWKINDPLLLSSVTNMDAPKVMPWLEAYGSVSRFMTANITGNNIIWSIFSNAPRDLMTYFTYSSDKNPVHILGGIGSAYANKVRGKNADPMFKEYLAMGGGKTSMYTADINLAKKVRNKISQDSKLSWLNPIEWMNFVSDTIELGPRYSYYKIMREKGYTPQEAFYESTDITVNFRRGGANSRTLNYVIPFFNAGVQGIDKFGRWVSAAEVTDGSRGKVARGRMISFMATSAALAALIYGLNSSDDDKKKDYAQLSNYTKNSFWCIPMGDGKYFTIPKPRELAVPSSFMEAAAEYFVNGNEHAMDDFYGYAANTILPNGVSDFAQGDLVGAFSSIGLIGTVFYMGANRDFLGNPIVSSGLINLEPKDQYTRRTSMIAKTVGGAFNVSPSMVDFFFQNTLGGWWKAQKALFPVGSENVDLTLGVQGTYVRDNQYSTDLTNWLYTQLDKDSKKKYSNPDDMSAALQYKWGSLMSTFYSTYNKLAKDKAETTGSRATRQTVLDMIIEYRKSYESGTTPKAQKTVNDICTAANSTEFAPSVMQSTVKDADDTQHTLSDIQYVEYQTQYLKLYWEYVDDALPKAKTQADKEAVLTAAKKMARDTATTNVLKRIGAPTEASKYTGVKDSSVVQFKAAVSSARSDGSLTQDEVLDILDRMMISDANRSTLFRSIYTSDKNNPWA